MKMQYVIGVITLCLILISTKFFGNETVVSENLTTAKVVSVSEPSAGSTGVGSNRVIATVQLDTGEKARLSFLGVTPSVGEQVRVKVSDYDNGDRRIVAASAY